ncbi:MAG: GIY-YIG nuclease family protein [Bacteroidetes bacterium]|nr:GIY-YIG nuclease family protein [Bacteroidota bacterium]
MQNIELENISIDEAEYSVFDFETTGTSAKYDKVIEIGIVKIKGNEIVDTYSTYINPGRQIPYYITDITGIKTEDIADAPYFEDIVNNIEDFFGDSILVAHNLQFDQSFLKSELYQIGRDEFKNSNLCTLKIARKLYPELKSKSLGSLVSHFRILHKGIHRALGDARATAEIFLKMMKHLKDDHDIETISDLINFQSVPSSKSSFRIIKKKLVGDFVSLPDSPGVYFFKDAKDKIIYIGKAKSLKKRVKNYFSNTAAKKAKKIVRQASRLGYHKTNSELTALLTEAELIKKHNPQHNTMLKKFSQNYFICAQNSHKYPDVKVVTAFDFDGNDYFGPYTSRETANTLVEIVNKTFMIRECNEKEFVKKRKCYLADIERCIAPCINDNIKKEYNEELIKVYDFLSGNNQNAVDRLLNKMKTLAENKKYEEAAEIRDSVNLILSQLNRSSIIAEPINNANVLVEINDFINKDFILLLEGKVFIKDYLLNEKDYFETALEDYFQGSIHLFQNINSKDLEKIKIAVAWMVKNRNNIKIYYLKDYDSYEDLKMKRALR